MLGDNLSKKELERSQTLQNLTSQLNYFQTSLTFVKIKRDEVYLFGLLFGFAVFWIVYVIPYLENSQDFLNLNPVFQYVIFNLGFISMTVFIINIPYRLILKKKIEFENMMRAGISTWLMFSFIYDLWQPPYYLSTQGQVLITQQQALYETSVDAMLSYVWGGIIPATTFVSGFSLLYIFVYFVTPIIAGLAIMLILQPKLFRKVILQQ